MSKRTPGIGLVSAAIIDSVFQNVKLGIVVADLNGNFLIFNKAAEQILGVGASEVDPSRWSATYGCYLPDKVTPYPTDRLPLLRAMRGERVTEELMYIRNEHREAGMWISITGTTLTDDQEAAIGGMVVFRDITELWLSNERLDSVKRQLGSLVEHQQAGILIENDERRILQANQVFCSLFDIAAQPADLIGVDCSGFAMQFADQLVDPEGFASRVEQLMHDGNPAVEDEVLFVDGKSYQRDYIPVVVSGKSRVHIWQYRDITEREAIKSKMTTYKRLCLALEQTADSVLITNGYGVIDYVNSAFETTTGYTSEEVLGRTPSILKSGHHDQEFYRELWQEISAGRTFNCTVRNKKRTGELYWAQQTITPVRESGDEITHYVSVLKDITSLLESKDKEAKLQLVREVQQKFYQASASLTGFDIAAIAYPADETGGDYFDFIDFPDGCLGIVVGDVSGHGIGTALVMTETRALVRAAAATSSDVVQIMTLVNQLLKQDLIDGQYVTLFLGLLHPVSKELTYASAGHNPGYVLEESGVIIQTLGATGIPLGLYADACYTANRAKFADVGQILFLSTDGVTEATNPNDTQFGIERVIQHISYQGHRSAQQIADSLHEKIRIHANHMPQQDDITAVVLKTI